MESHVGSAERRAVELAESSRRQYLVALEALGMSASPPEVERRNGDAEVTIYIMKDEDVVDVIEFHAVRDGKIDYVEEQLATWLRSCFQEVLTKAGHG